FLRAHICAAQPAVDLACSGDESLDVTHFHPEVVAELGPRREPEIPPAFPRFDLRRGAPEGEIVVFSYPGEMDEPLVDGPRQVLPGAEAGRAQECVERNEAF